MSSRDCSASKDSGKGRELNLGKFTKDMCEKVVSKGGSSSSHSDKSGSAGGSTSGSDSSKKQRTK